jgi:hypothetical protein
MIQSADSTTIPSLLTAHSSGLLRLRFAVFSA